MIRTWKISKAKLKQSASLKRKTTITVSVLSIASLAQFLPLGGQANGQTLADARAEAATIAARLSYLGGQVSFLAEKYNQAQLSLSNVNNQIASEQSQIASTESRITSIKSELSQEAINAYVTGGNLPEISALMEENPTQASVRQEYLNTVTNSQTDLVASFKAQTQSLKQEQSALKAAQAHAVTVFNQVSAAKTAANTAVAQEQAQLGSVNSTIASLVAQQQAIAAQEAAAKARQIILDSPSGSSFSPGNGASPSLRPAPPVNGSQTSVALSWARQELGKPYVFGGSGPNVFDCSGLTAYIYAKAGVSLPHSAAAQYNDTSRVSISQLQPGDLVFYYSPISHVAVYIGGGKVIQALNASAPVEVSGLYWAGVPVGAGRVS